jgi:uncharacterized LabA/DUF88 family protein
MRERAERIALFVDLENFVGFCLGIGLPIDLGPELARLTELGKIAVRRSFGDIYKLPIPFDKKADLRKMLQNNLIQHEDIPHFNAFKNTSDIRLVIDALSTAYTNDDIDMVAVVASDRDYLPLFAKLREIGKEIVGIGGNRDNTPELYVKACDYFFYHEVLCGGGPTAAIESMSVGSEKSGLTPPAEGAVNAGLDLSGESLVHKPTRTSMLDHSEAIQLLVEALQVLEGSGLDLQSGAKVIQMMRRLKADFDLASYGYSSFKELCLEARELGRIEIEQEGIIFNIRLAPPPILMESDQQLQLPEEIPQGTSCMHLQEWLESKMRISLPSVENRYSIYRNLAQILKDSENADGVKLTELSAQVKANISNAKGFQDVCFKVLYCLYRANCFTCSPGETPYNPVVNGLRDVESPEVLDAKFIENNLRIYHRECRVQIDGEGWSTVFFGSIEKADHIRDVARSL